MVKWRININMNTKTTYSPVSNLFSKQLNLLDFGFEKPVLKKIKEINRDIKPNKLLEFIKNTFKYSKIVLNKFTKEIIDLWSGSFHKNVNNYIRGKRFNKLYNQIFEGFIYELSKIINNADGLRQKTILFRGERNVDLSRYELGKIKSFKGFISTSFEKHTATKFAKLNKSKKNFIIKIVAKKGVKGVAINGKEIGEFPDQNEWLLNNGQKYITKSIDFDNQIIEIELI